MGKRARTASRDRVRSTDETAAGEVVGPRQPCPCGSGRRYKACHGDPKGGASGVAATYVARPFAGLPSECDVVAMRELVPAATAPLPLAADGGPEVTLCTVLPGAAPALVRDTGEVWLGLQVRHSFGDPARDLGAVLTLALEAAERSRPGVVGLTDPPGPGPRLQDLVADGALEVTVHEGFGFWFADVASTPETEAAIEQAGAAAHPTVRLPDVEAAYWTDVGTKEHLRWVMPEPEDELLSALARLHAGGEDVLVDDARLVGMFRAHGLLAPVWDLPLGTGAKALEEPAARFLAHLQAALADDTPLSAAERSARAGLANRQVTIR